jgi:hypothetical protein
VKGSTLLRPPLFSRVALYSALLAAGCVSGTVASAADLGAAPHAAPAPNYAQVERVYVPELYVRQGCIGSSHCLPPRVLSTQNDRYVVGVPVDFIRTPCGTRVVVGDVPRRVRGKCY